MSKKFRIAVASDFHAHSKPYDDKDAPSYLSLHSSDGRITVNPVAGIEALIKEKNLEADILLCPGDLGDKADLAAQNYVWRKLHDIGRQLNVSHVLATAGNHDLDSRNSADFDAKGGLQSLLPVFPGLSEEMCDRYWSRNYVIHENPEWRIVLLNSSAYHGGKAPKNDEHAGEEEFKRGRVSLRTLERLKTDLEGSNKLALNILLTHHHPARNSDIPDSLDYSEMVAGDQLLNLLSELNSGGWIIIHGHKHVPKIWYAGSGTGTGPVIMSAGSFSAKLYPEIGGIARNQFYIIEIDLEATASNQIGVLGQVYAWDWAPHIGWQEAKDGSGIPYVAGFGWRENADRVAQDIADAFAGLAVPFAQWADVGKNLPLHPYLSPQALKRLRKLLKEDHKLELLVDSSGPRTIGKMS